MTSYLILLFLNLAGFVLFEVLHPHFLSVLLKLISAMSKRKIIQNGFLQRGGKKPYPQRSNQNPLFYLNFLFLVVFLRKGQLILGRIIEQTCLSIELARTTLLWL